MSAIEWTDATWNPLAGCTVTSPGCANCYAMRAAASGRLRGNPKYDGLTKIVNGKPVWTGRIGEGEDRVWEQPLRWRKPRRVFVNSMGDLFHPNVTDAQIDRAFAIMALAPAHTFQILTKQAERMRDYMDGLHCDGARRFNVMAAGERYWRDSPDDEPPHDYDVWPLPNVWLGVSVEDEKHADARIPVLLDTPAARRFISVEPLLGPLDLTALDLAESGIMLDALTGKCVDAHFSGPALDHVIVGGESGPGSRDCPVEAIESIVRHCRAAGVPVFVKQLGAKPVLNGQRLSLKDGKGGDMSEWPRSLQVRQMPEAPHV